MTGMKVNDIGIGALNVWIVTGKRDLDRQDGRNAVQRAGKDKGL